MLVSNFNSMQCLKERFEAYASGSASAHFTALKPTTPHGNEASVSEARLEGVYEVHPSLDVFSMQSVKQIFQFFRLLLLFIFYNIYPPLRHNMTQNLTFSSLTPFFIHVSASVSFIHFLCILFT